MTRTNWLMLWCGIALALGLALAAAAGMMYRDSVMLGVRTPWQQLVYCAIALFVIAIVDVAIAMRKPKAPTLLSPSRFTDNGHLSARQKADVMRAAATMLESPEVKVELKAAAVDEGPPTDAYIVPKRRTLIIQTFGGA